MPPPSPPARPLVLGLVVLAGVATLLAAVASFATAVPGNLDDAFITLVYARHLVEDQALYWNAADGHLDGFTSLLDVGLKAALLRLTDDPLAMARDLSLGAHLAAGLAGLALIAMTAEARGSLRAVIAGGLVGLAISLHPAPAHGASFLLESPLYVTLAVVAGGLPLGVDLATHRAARRGWTAGLVLLCLVRPEGQALAVLLAGLHAGILARAQERAGRYGPLLAVAATLLTYYGWHLAYFGALLPNTFYAKSSPSRWQELVDGWRYVVAFASAHGVLGWATLALPGLLPLAWLVPGWQTAQARARSSLAAAAALAALLLVIAEGGDSYSGGRFLATPTALALLACGHLTIVGPRRVRRLAGGALVAFTLLAVVHLLQTFARGTPTSAIDASLDDYKCERQAAARLVSLTPGGEVMQTDWQRLKFFVDDARVIDLHGLNDREIARLPAPGSVRYGRYSHAHALAVGAPVWVYGYRLATEVPMAAVPMVDLLQREPVYRAFVGYGAPPEQVEATAAAYLPASLPVCRRYFNVLVRNEYAASFARAGVLVGDGTGKPLRLPPGESPSSSGTPPP